MAHKSKKPEPAVAKSALQVREGMLLLEVRPPGMDVCLCCSLTFQECVSGCFPCPFQRCWFPFPTTEKFLQPSIQAVRPSPFKPGWFQANASRLNLRFVQTLLFHC